MTRQTWMLPTLGLAVLGVAVAVLAQPRAATPTVDSTAVRWEYARLTADGDTFVLVTTGAVYRVELPAVEPVTDPTIFRSPTRLTEKRFDRRLYTLNVLAADGWEIEPGADLRPGEWYLVRRRR